MSIIIPRCGFNRNTKREVLYGPIELGGANFRHLFVEQGIGQLQVGTSYSLLERVHTSLPHLESKWILSLREFLASIDSQLQLDNASIPQTQRQHDTHIMDGILSSGKFTAAEIRRLNYCRLYLQAQTISDLATISGESSDTSKTFGKLSNDSSITRGVHINQQRPSEPEWRLWRKANRLWSDENGVLTQPLGPWLCPMKQQRQQHHAYCHKRTLWIRHNNDNYLQCKLTGGDDRVYRCTGIMQSWHEILDESVPVVVAHVYPNRWRVEMKARITSLPRSINPATFDQYIETLEPWEVELLSHVELSEDPFTIGVALSHGL
ncbi:hypothetical protein MHU86_14180 [Fragilaria crotonensis]|nr:hypothetical protein MHU86_14180 [Fragilaria crotonensis]